MQIKEENGIYSITNRVIAEVVNKEDEYIKKHSECEVDYIHGEDNVKVLAHKPKTIGILFAGMKKSELFPSVVSDGSLPRKTFSMGHACDKRFYLECRKITK